MLILTTALNRIYNWLERHRPSDALFLQPGLSKAEIEILAKELPFQLPQEVIELYQWRNGSRIGRESWEFAWVFDRWSFLPLQEAVVKYQQSPKYDEPWSLCNFRSAQSFQIFFTARNSDEGYIAIDNRLETFPVFLGYCRQGVCLVKLKYASLTNMMLTIAECYETGAYYNYDATARVYANFCGPFINSIEDKITNLWWKYNAGIKKIAIVLLRKELKRRRVTEVLLDEIKEDLLEFNPDEAVPLLIQTLQMELEYPVALEEMEFIGDYRGKAAELLGKLGDSSSVEPLVNALQDEFWHTRYRVVKALGQLRDKRAIQPLIKCLEDDSEEVRELAAWTLEQVFSSP